MGQRRDGSGMRGVESWSRRREGVWEKMGWEGDRVNTCFYWRGRKDKLRRLVDNWERSRLR